MNFASMFSGGGGADLGATAAGLTPLWAVEYDPAIAGVYRQNLSRYHQHRGDCIIVGDVSDVDYMDLTRPDVLWASPSCKNASVANANRGETEEDRRAGRAVEKALIALTPRWFVLENVTQYRDFDAYKGICRTLDRLGYWWHASFVQAADLGVPQTRRRLILRACRDGMLPGLPDPVPWRGWYEAIEDLLPTCPESQLAPWQMKRLPEELRTLLVSNGGEHGDLTREPRDAAPCVTGESNGRVKAVLVDGQNTGHVISAHDGKGPAFTVTSNPQRGWPKAILIDGKQIHPDGSITTREERQPSWTVGAQAMDRDCHAPRAVLIVSTNPGGRGDKQREDSEPCSTVTRESARDRALLFDGQTNEGERMTIREGQEPSFTVSSSATHRPARALAGVRVVKLTPRCLARFQTFPNDYELPEKASLACMVIGNAVPVLLAQRIIESMIEQKGASS